MRKIIKRLAVLFLTAVTIVGCDNGYDCSLNNTSYNNYYFYTKTDGIDSVYYNPNALSVSLMINGKDSIMINHLTDAANISLPMSYTQGTDTVVIHYDDFQVCDSLYINHSNKPFYQSMECGTLMYHYLEGVSHTFVFLDSVAIINNDVNFDGHENIRLYFIK